jgi:DNA-binding MarR family transcriptional regulator
MPAMKASENRVTGRKHVAEGDGHFGWLTTDIARLMRTVFARRVKALGLTRPQWLAIVRLKRHPGASQSELADMMEIEKAPAGKIVDRLEERRWVERRADPVDRRVNRIFLTERGERLYALISPIAQATVYDALADLSDVEIVLLNQLLARVKSRLGEMAESDPLAEAALLDKLEEPALGNAHPV